MADTQNHRVQVFADDGQYLWEIGKAGRGPAEFDSPRGIATDDQGYIYVADTGNGGCRSSIAPDAMSPRWGTSAKAPANFTLQRP